MHSNTRYFLLLLALFTSLQASALTIKPFEVRYHVYRGDSYVANTRFSLQKNNAKWIWSMQTAPRGIYSWLTPKKPYAETHMQQTPQGIQLLLEHTGNYQDKPPERSSWFDHAHQIIYYKKGEKISQLDLPQDAYNYHSIHLLYPLMLEQNKSQMTINFYQHGELVKSTLTLEKQLELSDKSSRMIVDKVTQSFEGSAKQMVYYYQGEIFAPLKIEQLKPGKDSSVMWRVSSNPG